MEGFFILLLCICGFFIVVGPIVSWTLVSSMKRRLESMEREFSSVRIRIDRLIATKPEESTSAKSPLPEPEPTPPAPAPMQVQVPPPPPLPPKPVPPKTETPASPLPTPKTLAEAAQVSTPIRETPSNERTPSEWERAGREALTKIWNWLIVGEEHRKPGVPMEYAVATNWLVRIGVLIMVVGIAFFLEYSASQGWLGPQGRFSITLLAGAGILGTGIRMLGKKYHLLAQGFLGTGLATWYVALYIGHMKYDLFGAPQAFLYMGIVTTCAAILSVHFHSLLVAVLGIVGGYGTPFLLPGAGNLLGLYTYLLVLGGGVLAVAHRRNWHLLNFLSFASTVLLVGTSIFQQNPTRMALA